MVIMSELIKPEPLEAKKRTLSRRDFMGRSAAAAIAGGIGLFGYTGHVKDSLEPEIAPTRLIERHSPSAMGATSQKQSEVYDEHHIPLLQKASNGLIGIGGLTMVAYIVDKHVIEPIRAERALYKFPDDIPETTVDDPDFS